MFYYRNLIDNTLFSSSVQIINIEFCKEITENEFYIELEKNRQSALEEKIYKKTLARKKNKIKNLTIVEKGQEIIPDD